jgi:predicted transcriptional regulator
MMTDLIEKLKEIAKRANDSDSPFIERAIDRIEELEAELAGHKEDNTDWRASVEKQMRRRRDDN